MVTEEHCRIGSHIPYESIFDIGWYYLKTFKLIAP